MGRPRTWRPQLRRDSLGGASMTTVPLIDIVLVLVFVAALAVAIMLSGVRPPTL